MSNEVKARRTMDALRSAMADRDCKGIIAAMHSAEAPNWEEVDDNTFDEWDQLCDQAIRVIEAAPPRPTR